MGGAPPPPPDFAPQGGKNGTFFGPRRGPENGPCPPRIKVRGGVGGAENTNPVGWGVAAPNGRRLSEGWGEGGPW